MLQVTERRLRDPAPPAIGRESGLALSCAERLANRCDCWGPRLSGEYVHVGSDQAANALADRAVTRIAEREEGRLSTGPRLLISGSNVPDPTVPSNRIEARAISGRLPPAERYCGVGGVRHLPRDRPGSHRSERRGDRRFPPAAAES